MHETERRVWTVLGVFCPRCGFAAREMIVPSGPDVDTLLCECGGKLTWTKVAVRERDEIDEAVERMFSENRPTIKNTWSDLD